MSRAPLIVCGVLLVLIVGLVWWVQRVPPVAEAGAATAATPTPSPSEPATSVPAEPDRFVANERNSRRAEATADGTVLIPDLAATARRLHTAETTGADDLALLQSLVTFYRRTNQGTGPGGGENEEIVAELRGRNAHKLALLPPDLKCFDARGRLLDRWGTPYHFHPVSRTALEIRSAGPDRELWTGDDLTDGQGE